MIAQLIQALYNMVDSYFVGRLSADGLTALSAIYPAQLCITAIAVGTGTGVGARMAQQLATQGKDAANRTAGTGMVLAAISWALFSCITLVLLPWFARVSVQSAAATHDTMAYGYIVGLGSVGLFLESMWSQVLQAEGNTVRPMIAQAVGKGMESAGLSLLRQIICLLPSFYLLSRIGLAWCWLAFPIAEVVTAVVGSVLYFRETKGWKE